VWTWAAASLSIIAFIAIGLWLTAPWYQPADREKLEHLRATFSVRRTESIEQFLSENSEYSRFFIDRPAEHPTLDRFSELAGAIGILWLAFVGIVLLSKLDKANAAKREQERKRLAAIEAAQPTRGQILCPYCSSLIAEDVLYAGQTITCPSCHGTLVAPGGPGPALRKAELEHAQNTVAIQFLGVIGSIIFLVVVARGCF
jgi:hypothetical protein